MRHRHHNTWIGMALEGLGGGAGLENLINSTYLKTEIPEPPQ